MKKYTHILTEKGKFPLSAYTAVFKTGYAIVMEKTTFAIVAKVKHLTYGTSESVVSFMKGVQNAV